MQLASQSIVKHRRSMKDSSLIYPSFLPSRCLSEVGAWAGKFVTSFANPHALVPHLYNHLKKKKFMDKWQKHFHIVSDPAMARRFQS